MLTATVSGSFHRHMNAIYATVHELFGLGVNVLSPADPRVVDFKGEFLFVASDKLRSVRLVQARHFEAIRSSHFLWVVCPDGYVGASTSAEIGAAYMAGTPVFTERLPLDITLQEFVTKAPSLKDVVAQLRSAQDAEVRRRGSAAVSHLDHLLLDPGRTIEASIGAMERLGPVLMRQAEGDSELAEREFGAARQQIGAAFGLRSR